MWLAAVSVIFKRILLGSGENDSAWVRLGPTDRSSRDTSALSALGTGCWQGFITRAGSRSPGRRKNEEPRADTHYLSSSKPGLKREEEPRSEGTLTQPVNPDRTYTRPRRTSSHTRIHAKGKTMLYTGLYSVRKAKKTPTLFTVLNTYAPQRVFFRQQMFPWGSLKMAADFYPEKLSIR